MVRINIIGPRNLADQHLVAEYLEILMLLGYVKKHPKNDNIPESYALGKGHILFFKDKLKYLKKRHELIKQEMRRRRFKTEHTINLGSFPKILQNDWQPARKDKEIIKRRLIQKIKLKPDYYRYCGEKKKKEFFIKLIKDG
jgi:deoxyribonuclease (pyrimidine dimer)